jgi:hypothetical protein
MCHNPSFKLETKARAYKGAGQERSLRVTSHIPWNPEISWTLTFPSELPFWELESQWALEPSESDCKGQNPLDWNLPYIIEKLLEHRCLKWACMTHLDT